MAVGDSHVFAGFFYTSTNTTFFPKPPTTFLMCFCRGERQKYARQKIRLYQITNSEPPGHESDTLATGPSGQEMMPFTIIVPTVDRVAKDQTANELLSDPRPKIHFT